MMILRRVTVSKTKTAGILLVLSASLVALAIPGLRTHALGLCIGPVVVTSRGTFSAKAVDLSSGTIDATGCDIGDYIDTSMGISGLTVHDADRFGIFVDSGGAIPGVITVTISGATVFNIGNHVGTSFMPDGSQRGVGIIYDSGAGGPLASGTITSSSVRNYQKGGIVINHNSNVTTTGNTIVGLGPKDFIAQNGIQYSRGAMGEIRGNTVSGNFYTGGQGVLADGASCGPGNPTSTCPPGRLYVSCGLLLFDIDPSNIRRGQNDLSNNQRPGLVITDSALG